MTITEKQELRSKFRGYAYYLLIAVISLISIVFLPMLGSELDGGFKWPESKIGWVIWIMTRAGIAVVNVCFFALFKAQAKLNVSNDKNYKEACDILNRYNRYKKIIPRSPAKYNLMSWGVKGTTLLISSIFSTFAFAEAILKFDLVAFLSYVFTIVVGLIFSYFTMRRDEDYYIDEFYQYALMKQAEMDQELSETGQESNETLSDKELSKENVKEAENA